MDDYAFLADGLLELYLATGDTEQLGRALRLPANAGRLYVVYGSSDMPPKQPYEGFSNWVSPSAPTHFCGQLLACSVDVGLDGTERETSDARDLVVGQSFPVA